MDVGCSTFPFFITSRALRGYSSLRQGRQHHSHKRPAGLRLVFQTDLSSLCALSNHRRCFICTVFLKRVRGLLLLLELESEARMRSEPSGAVRCSTNKNNKVNPFLTCRLFPIALFITLIRDLGRFRPTCWFVACR